jgi:hypothetical protein
MIPISRELGERAIEIVETATEAVIAGPPAGGSATALVIPSGTSRSARRGLQLIDNADAQHHQRLPARRP